MHVLSTGIPELDRAIGGGLLEEGNLLILYDSYSYGWVLAFEILRNRINEGDFGVILDSVMPLTPLSMEVGVSGFNIEEEGRRGNLAVIDVLSSFYRIQLPEVDFVYYLPGVDAATFLPKYLEVYRKILKDKIKDRRPVGVTVTMDGFGFMFGEETFIRVFQNLIGVKEKAKMTEKRKRPLNIFLLNKGRASEKFVAWIALYSQYVIEFSSESPGTERMFVWKSPLPNFVPEREGYSFTFRRGEIRID